MENVQTNHTNGNKMKNSTNQIFCPHCEYEFNIDEAIAHLIHKGKKDADLKKEKAIENKFSKNFEIKLSEEKDKLEEKYSKQNSLKFNEIESKNTELENQLQEYSKNKIENNKLQLEYNKILREKNELEGSLSVKIENKLKPIFQREADKKIEVKKLALEQKVEEKIIELQQEKLKTEKIRKKIEEEREILNQGSIQAQGEAMEITLEKWLKNEFPEDKITEVKKGVAGADIIQNVKDGLGKIIIESKNHKRFDKKWIPKLKKDMKDASATKGIIVTKILPKEMPKGGFLNGIWIYDTLAFKQIISLIRHSVLQESKFIQSNSNSKEKSALAYRYVLSDDYNNEIATQIQIWLDETSDLAKEMTSSQAMWAKRRTRHDAVKKSMSNVYGTLKAIMGASIPEVKIFEIPQKAISNKKKKASK